MTIRTSPQSDPLVRTPKFNRLLVEVIADIFIGCLPKDPEHIPSTSCASLLLCRVCSLWRDIAIQTPCLCQTRLVIAAWPGDVIVTDAPRPRDALAVAYWFARAGRQKTRVELKVYAADVSLDLDPDDQPTPAPFVTSLQSVPASVPLHDVA